MNIHDSEPCYVISVVARMLGVHAQTLRYYEKAGRLDLALPHLLILLEKDPENSELLGSICRIYVQTDRFSDALPYFEKYVALQPENTSFTNPLLNSTIDFGKDTISLYRRLLAVTPDDLELLWPETTDSLYYVVEDFDTRIEFEPNDFTQVNAEINRKMIAQTIELMDLGEEDTVLDLFSGLGNFTLPIARRCAQVTGVEGSLAMVKKARHNAEVNGIGNAAFHYADLYSDEVKETQWVRQQYSRILLDPPRSGAAGILGYIKRMKAERIVYVSCHPATLARDAGVLVNELGYKLIHAGVMDMFPHTAHVESIAVFDRD